MYEFISLTFIIMVGIAIATIGAKDHARKEAKLIETRERAHRLAVQTNHPAGRAFRSVDSKNE